MKTNLLIKISILAIIISSFSIPSLAAPQFQSSVTLEEINLGLGSTTLKEWYDAQNSYPGNDTLFGAFVTQAVGGNLYIGLGSARPAEQNGAHLARFDGTPITSIGELDEQGVHEIIWANSLLQIAGTDPTDSWAAGNHYIYSPFTKYRDTTNGLVNVIHTWGLWAEGSTIYAAVSSHDGTYPDPCTYGVTCRGEIFSSTNNGVTWTKLSNLGDYRAYDIIGFNGALYAIHNDELGAPTSLSKSTTGGTSWTVTPKLTENVRKIHLVTHPIGFDDHLIAASFDRTALYSINSSDQVVTHTLPTGYLVGTSYTCGSPPCSYSDYNAMVSVGEYLYIVAEDQAVSGNYAILRSADLTNWERMVQIDERLISLSYWSAHSWLITSTQGTNARLLRVDISGTPTSVSLNEFSAFRSIQLSSMELFLSSCVLGIVSIWLLRRIKLRQKNEL